MAKRANIVVIRKVASMTISTQPPGQGLAAEP